MTRQEKLLCHLDRNGCGLEIGPSHNPIAPKKAGYRVEIIDHLPKAQLVEKYREHNVNLDNIEEVDYVWQGESYLELTGKPKFYDWIIASHVIEHTPDLIKFLDDCDSILRDDGVLSLAVPDARYCFDHFRPISGLGGIIDAHVRKDTIHTPGTVAEYTLNVVSKGGRIAWGAGMPGEYRLLHSAQAARERATQVAERNIYIDVHAWCFTPHSFRLLIHDLHALGLTAFQELAFFPSEGCEFFIALSRKARSYPFERLEFLQKIAAENACRE